MAFPGRKSRYFAIQIAGVPLRYGLFHLFFYCAFRLRFVHAGVRRQALYATLLAILLLAALLLPNEAARAIIGTIGLKGR